MMTETSPKPTKSAVLSLNNIEVVYDHVSLAIKGVSLEVVKFAEARFSFSTVTYARCRLKSGSNSESRTCSKAVESLNISLQMRI